MTLPTSLAACSRICMRGDRAARERVAPTRSPHSRPNSACRTRRFGARSRGTSSGASSAARVGSFRQTQWTSGRLRRTCIPRGPVGVRSAPCRSQSGRSLCAQFSAERVKRHAAKLAGARDERRENNAGEWRRRLACALGGSTAGTVREPSALAATPATSTRRSVPNARPEASPRSTLAQRLSANT